jgi:hypothetical protein
MSNKSNYVVLKAPNIDLVSIHPMILLMEKLKPTKAKVSLYFHDIYYWLKSIQSSLEEYRVLQNMRQDKKFVDDLNSDKLKVVDYYEKLTYFLENAVIRISAVRDKIAITSYVYYRHPNHIGSNGFQISGCTKCGNKAHFEDLTELNCNFGSLLRFLDQEKIDDKLSKLLRKINTDSEITQIITQRNSISHRISKYHWIGLGLVPQDLDIKYENGQETISWAIGNNEHELLKLVLIIESSYNKLVSYTEELAEIYFS